MNCSNFTSKTPQILTIQEFFVKNKSHQMIFN